MTIVSNRFNVIKTLIGVKTSLDKITDTDVEVVLGSVKLSAIEKAKQVAIRIKEERMQKLIL